MAYAVGTRRITTARVTLPRTGAWTVDLTASPAQGTDGDALTGSQAVTFDGLALSGTVVRSAVVDGAITARIVGGAGGLSGAVTERFYRGGSTVRRIAEDLLRDVGETLDTASDSTVLGQIVPTWQRAREPAGVALSRLLEPVSASWRVTPGGTVLVVGAESWPVVAPTHTMVPGSAGEQGVYAVAWADGAPADVLPGVTFRGMRVRYVTHELDAGGLRSEIRTEEPRAAIERLRAVLSRDSWYSRLWPAVVDKQNADGSVDVVIAGQFGETAVVLRHGLPGVTVLVEQGQQVLVGYESDDPSRPFAALWTASGTAKIGTLVLAQNASSLAMLPPQWFSAGPTGDAAAAAALAVITGGGNVGYSLPVTVPIVEVT